MQDLKQCGTDTLVSLMEGHEYRYFGISALYEGDEVGGIKILRFAIRVMDVPEEAEVEDYEAVILKIVEHLEAGKNVVVHCRGCLGQTGTAGSMRTSCPRALRKRGCRYHKRDEQRDDPDRRAGEVRVPF